VDKNKFKSQRELTSRLVGAQRSLAMSPETREGSAEEDAVANFREYLRIPSVQPDVNYGTIYVHRSVDVIIVCTYYREQIVSATRRISVYVHLVLCGEVTSSPSKS
jgi:hypothetical protein